MEITNDKLYELLLKMNQDISNRFDKVDMKLLNIDNRLVATQKQVADITEQLTTTKNIKKIFSEETLKAVEAV